MQSNTEEIMTLKRKLAIAILESKISERQLNEFIKNPKLMLEILVGIQGLLYQLDDRSKTNDEENKKYLWEKNETMQIKRDIFSEYSKEQTIRDLVSRKKMSKKRLLRTIDQLSPKWYKINLNPDNPINSIIEDFCKKQEKGAIDELMMKLSFSKNSEEDSYFEEINKRK
jgi:predicted RND superfamily exporter protein